jgi:hypothetical protein
VEPDPASVNESCAATLEYLARFGGPVQVDIRQFPTAIPPENLEEATPLATGTLLDGCSLG